jgi:hypothetical protein
MSEKTFTCPDCGATTTDPVHGLIIYFHEDCPAKKGI